MPPVIDGFTDLVEVGRGGFGTVYRAHQVDPAREVAVKVLPDVRADSDAFGRFTREFQALAAVGGHPNIARVHACGVTADGSGFLALELLPGGSLGDRVRAGAQPWADVASWGVQLSGALETAHRAGITHRDLKPENVLFDGTGTPKLVDFGIAGVPGAFRTATGSVTLTLAHAAPEVVAGGRGGVPGDVYSLASALYAALAGGAAFVAEADETLVPMLARIATAPVPDLREKGVPDAVCAALERGMAKDPADRPASAEALGMSLQAALAREGISAAAPPLLLSPGVAAPFVVSESAPAVGASPAAYVAAGYEGERTITGWVPPVEVPAAASLAAPRRRRSRLWVAAASVAAVSAAFLVWRGGEPPAPAAASPEVRQSQSGTPTPSPSPSGTGSTTTPSTSPSASAPRPSPSASATTSAAAPPASLVIPSRSPSAAPRRTTASPSADPAPAPSSTASSPTPPPPAVPRAPRAVRVGGAALLPAGAGSTAQVSVRLAWKAPAAGAAPSAYEVRWSIVSGPARGTRTVAMSVAATSAVVLVPQPASGVRYEWQVRSVLAGKASAWSTARVTVPQVVGRRAAPARTTLRALGIASSTYTQAATSKASVGRVLTQSLPRGRAVAAGTSIALGIGKAP